MYLGVVQSNLLIVHFKVKPTPAGYTDQPTYTEVIDLTTVQPSGEFPEPGDTGEKEVGEGGEKDQVGVEGEEEVVMVDETTKVIVHEPTGKEAATKDAGDQTTDTAIVVDAPFEGEDVEVYRKLDIGDIGERPEPLDLGELAEEPSSTLLPMRSKRHTNTFQLTPRVRILV